MNMFLWNKEISAFYSTGQTLSGSNINRGRHGNKKINGSVGCHCALLPKTCVISCPASAVAAFPMMETAPAPYLYSVYNGSFLQIVFLFMFIGEKKIERDLIHRMLLISYRFLCNS